MAFVTHTLPKAPNSGFRPTTGMFSRDSPCKARVFSSDTPIDGPFALEQNGKAAPFVRVVRY